MHCIFNTIFMLCGSVLSGLEGAELRTLTTCKGLEKPLPKAPWSLLGIITDPRHRGMPDPSYWPFLRSSTLRRCDTLCILIQSPGEDLEGHRSCLHSVKTRRMHAWFFPFSQGFHLSIFCDHPWCELIRGFFILLVFFHFLSFCTFFKAVVQG